MLLRRLRRDAVSQVEDMRSVCERFENIVDSSGHVLSTFDQAQRIEISLHRNM